MILGPTRSGAGAGGATRIGGAPGPAEHWAAVVGHGAVDFRTNSFERAEPLASLRLPICWLKAGVWRKKSC
jgi:hypothetical protein